VVGLLAAMALAPSTGQHDAKAVDQRQRVENENKHNAQTPTVVIGLACTIFVRDLGAALEAEPSRVCVAFRAGILDAEVIDPAVAVATFAL